MRPGTSRWPFLIRSLVWRTARDRHQVLVGDDLIDEAPVAGGLRVHRFTQ